MAVEKGRDLLKTRDNNKLELNPDTLGLQQAKLNNPVKKKKKKRTKTMTIQYLNDFPNEEIKVRTVTHFPTCKLSVTWLILLTKEF